MNRASGEPHRASDVELGFGNGQLPRAVGGPGRPGQRPWAVRSPVIIARGFSDAGDQGTDRGPGGLAL